jgi:hypothetical protein
MKVDSEDKIHSDHDYINSKRYKNSLDLFMKSNDRGVPDSVIAHLLLMSVDEVKECYKSAVATLRDALGVD